MQTSRNNFGPWHCNLDFRRNPLCRLDRLAPRAPRVSTATRAPRDRRYQQETMATPGPRDRPGQSASMHTPGRPGQQVPQETMAIRDQRDRPAPQGIMAIQGRRDPPGLAIRDRLAPSASPDRQGQPAHLVRRGQGFSLSHFSPARSRFPSTVSSRRRRVSNW